MKFRTYLAVLVLAGVVPLVGLTAIVTASLARQQREALERGRVETATALATAIDNELAASVKSLQTLAASDRLERDDLPAFYAEAHRVRLLHPWTTVGLIDASGQHLLNVARPLGSPLPDLRDREYFKQVVSTGRAYISEPLRGRATGTTDVVIAVSVRGPGSRLKYVLFAGMDPTRLTAQFEAQRLPPDVVASIVTRAGLIVSRTDTASVPVGQAADPDYLERIQRSPAGTFRLRSPAGEMDVAFRRIPVTGWTVGLAAPAPLLDAPARRVMWSGALVGGAIIAAALVLAVVFARRMQLAVGEIGEAASALGRGELRGLPTALPIAELESMRRSLTEAARLLGERERQRDDLLRIEQEMRAAAETANRAKDEFLAMLGHELRNPLGAIASAMGVLGAGGDPAPGAAWAHAVIGRQVQLLSRLVDDLLDVSRVTTGKVRLNLQPLDLSQLVTTTMAAWRSARRFERHRVAADVARSVWVEADETRMEQVLGNLVGNALKYTPAGGEVRVRVTQDGDDAVLEVADTGPGIPPDLLGKVFEPFVQGDRALDRAQGGLGIGLTLVRALAGLHGGTAEAMSVGTGSTFVVRVPAIPTPVLASSLPAPAPDADPRRRVLVVEDNDDAREMLRVLLTLAGHSVHEAGDGRTGIAVAAETGPEVALIDVGLPGLDGYEVARRIRATPGGASMRLIAITGYGQSDDRRRALDAGFDAHLTKPVQSERLLAVIAGRAAP